MTSQTETTDFDMNLVDLLQKKFCEEKKAHGETTLQLLTAQAQAQTAGAEATKAQEVVAETTLKLDQAREEIKGLRAQAQDVQAQAQEAQAMIKDMETQMAQMRLSEQSQAQTAIEAQEEVRRLRAQTQELETARATIHESLSQELETAQAKIVNLEARMVKARAFFVEIDVEMNSEPRDQAEELKAAQARIENLEVQMAQMKLFEQFQAQSEKLKAAQTKIAELEAQMAQNEKQAQEEIILLNSKIQDQKAQDQELEAAQTQVKDMESQVAQAQEEILSLRAHTEAQAQELKESQAKIKDLEAQVPKPPTLHALMPEVYTMSRSEFSEQNFCIVQNNVRLYFVRTLSGYIFTKFVPKKDATLELAGPDIFIARLYSVTVSDGQDWERIGHVGPENNTILIGSLVWKWVTERTPARINAYGNQEYQLAIRVRRLD